MVLCGYFALFGCGKFRLCLNFMWIATKILKGFSRNDPPPNPLRRGGGFWIATLCVDCQAAFKKGKARQKPSPALKKASQTAKSLKSTAKSLNSNPAPKKKFYKKRIKNDAFSLERSFRASRSSGWYGC